MCWLNSKQLFCSEFPNSPNWDSSLVFSNADLPHHSSTEMLNSFPLLFHGAPYCGTSPGSWVATCLPCSPRHGTSQVPLFARLPPACPPAFPGPGNCSPLHPGDTYRFCNPRLKNPLPGLPSQATAPHCTHPQQQASFFPYISHSDSYTFIYLCAV